MCKKAANSVKHGIHKRCEAGWKSESGLGSGSLPSCVPSTVTYITLWDPKDHVRKESVPHLCLLGLQSLGGGGAQIRK